LQTRRISFTVSTIDCVACTPIFKWELEKLPGVRGVKPLVMLNRLDVELDPTVVSVDDVKERILTIAKKAGFEERVIFHPPVKDGHV
jgi:copper chaperone CopZ